MFDGPACYRSSQPFTRFAVSTHPHASMLTGSGAARPSRTSSPGRVFAVRRNLNRGNKNELCSRKQPADALR